MQNNSKNENQKIAVGLDIGTTKICAIVLTEGDRNGTYNIIGCDTIVNSGVNRGVIVNIEKTVEAIKNVIAKTEQQAGTKISEVVVGIAGDHIESFSEVSTISISNPKLIISPSDVERAIDELRKSKISADRKIIHIVPYEYIIDGQDGFTHPIGAYGRRMQANVHIVTGIRTAVQNINLCVEQNAGLKVKDIILEPIASSIALLGNDEKEVGVCLIDIGGGTTDITIFKDEVLRFTSVIAIGGNKITDDVRTGIGTTKDEAERVKRTYGHSYKPSIMKREEVIMIRGVGGSPHKEITKEELCDIIQPRVEELFEICNEELVKSGFANGLGAGIVLTGGSALLKGVDELASRIFKLPIRIGYPSGDRYIGLSTEIESPIYSTAVGLALHSLSMEAVESIKGAAYFDDHSEEKYNSTVEDDSEESDLPNDQTVSEKRTIFQKAKDFFTDL
jgi:cell division protein FtsA